MESLLIAGFFAFTASFLCEVAFAIRLFFIKAFAQVLLCGKIENFPVEMLNNIPCASHQHGRTHQYAAFVGANQRRQLSG
ncbi:hypothetical protein [Undibacterium sp.]|uniref:hypothetical protein n=1 Tax=Undibacterium sp. TaxID=1914977 RepID=UPI00374D4FAF